MKSKRPLYTYKHKTRTVYVHEVDKFEWMETTKGYFVPNQNKNKIRKYQKDSIPSNAIKTVTAIKNDLIPPPPKPVPYKEQVLIDTYASPVRCKKKRKRGKSRKRKKKLRKHEFSRGDHSLDTDMNESFQTQLNHTFAWEKNSEKDAPGTIDIFGLDSNTNIDDPFVNSILFEDFVGSLPKREISFVGLQTLFKPNVVCILCMKHASVLTSLNFQSLTQEGSVSSSSKKKLQLLHHLFNGCCIWKKLKYVDISKNPSINNIILTAIGQNCPNIESINLSFIASIDDTGLRDLSTMRPTILHWKLRSCNRVSNVGIKYIVNNCVGLKSLDVGGEQSVVDDGGILYALNHAKSLEKLNCSNNRKITDVCLSDLEVEHKLEHFNFSRCKLVIGSLSSYLSNLKRITHLDLSFCSFLSDMHLNQLATNRELCKSFVILKFQMCKGIGDKAMAKLVEFSKSLKEIDLSHCKNIGDKTVLSLAKTTSSNWLKRISLIGCQSVTGKSLGVLCNKLKYVMQDLKLGSGYKVNDVGRNTYEDKLIHSLKDSEAVADAISKLKMLKILDMCGLFRLSDTAVLNGICYTAALKVEPHLSNLTQLSLSGCSGLSQDALTTLVQKMKKLRLLNLASLANVTDSVIVSFRENLHVSLEHLNLRNCAELTNDACISISYLLNLKVLDLGRCYQIDNNGIYHLQFNSNLQRLNLRGLKFANADILLGASYILDSYSLSRTQSNAHTSSSRGGPLDHLKFLYFLDVTSVDSITRDHLKLFLARKGSTPGHCMLTNATHHTRTSKTEISSDADTYFGFKPRPNASFVHQKILFMKMCELANNAATKIQCIMRGKISKRVALERRKAIEKEEREKALAKYNLRQYSAMLLQCTWHRYQRIMLVRKLWEHMRLCLEIHKMMENAANRIQKFCKYKLCVKKLWKIVHFRHIGATQFQRCFRGWMTRNTCLPILKLKLNAIIVIQNKFFLYVLCRRRFFEKIEEEKITIRLKNASSICISSAWRRYVAYKKICALRLARQVYASNVIRRSWHFYLRRCIGLRLRNNIYEEKQRAAIKIQTRIRIFQAKKLLQQMREKKALQILKNNCAIEIQRIIRGWQSRFLTDVLLAEVRQRKGASVKIQAFIRGAQSRKRTNRMMEEKKKRELAAMSFEKMVQFTRHSISENLYWRVEEKALCFATNSRALKIRKAVVSRNINTLLFIDAI